MKDEYPRNALGDLHGDVILYHSNGKVRKKTSYRFGNLEGMQTTFNEVGQKIREEPYVGGELHGTVRVYRGENVHIEKDYIEDNLREIRMYYVNGSLKQKMPIRDGVPHGETLSRNKKLECRMHFVGGDLTGPIIQKNLDSGTVILKCEMKDGELHGPFLAYNERGEPTIRAPFHEGNLHGTAEAYNQGDCVAELDMKHGSPIEVRQYSQGVLSAIVPLQDGQAHGTIRAFDTAGVLKAEIPMVEGRTHGLMKGYLEGTLRVEQEYVKGRREGKQLAYYEDGTLAQEAHFKNDKFHGEKKMYSQDGVLMAHEHYKDGKKVGTARTYYPTGDPMEETPKGPKAEYSRRGRMKTLQYLRKEASAQWENAREYIRTFFGA